MGELTLNEAPHDAAEPGGIRIVLAWSPGPREVIEWPMTLPEGTTVGQALALARSCAAHQAQGQSMPTLEGLQIAVWGRAADVSLVLRDRDRLELLRPLRVDPKVARRERFQKQGSRGAGLFSRRPGGRGPEGPR